MRDNDTYVEQLTEPLMELIRDVLLDYKDIIQNRVITMYNESDEEYDYTFHGSEKDNIIELESIEEILLEKHRDNISQLVEQVLDRIVEQIVENL